MLNFISKAQEIPSSPLSKSVIQAQKPLLKAQIKLLSDSLGLKNLQLGNAIFIRIFKESQELEMWIQANEKFVLFKTYKICTYGGKGIGPKIKQGDGKAPEGFYFVKANQMNPYSKYHLSFNLGYPNAYDKSHKRTGSALMVHGECVSIGCFAMQNANIEEIYTLAHLALENGKDFFRVHIFPFCMTEENLQKQKNSKWFDFWKNLKEGYDFFEKNNFPPDVIVQNKKYKFY